MARKMKDSGIEWIGEIPKDWNIRPIYYYFEERKNKNSLGKEYNLLSLSYGNIVRKNINTSMGLLPESFNTYNIIEKDDIIIRPTDLQNDKKSLRTGLSREHGIITSAYIALKAIRTINVVYFYYLLHSYDIQKVFYNMGNGVRQGLNFTEFSKLTVLEPDIAEQNQIVNYLNSKCAEINSLSSDIQSQISILEDYKKSVITEAVTKGLNPDVEMKDSGIEWIGAIPQNWNCIKLKYVVEKIGDIDHYMPETQLDGIPYVMTGDLKDLTSEIDFEKCKKVSYEDFQKLSNKIQTHFGDIILARYATIGTVSYVDVNKDFLVSYSCVTIKPTFCLKGKFLFYYIKTSSFIEELKKYTNSNTQGNVGIDSLYQAKIVIPSIEEQDNIIAYLDDKCAEVDGTIKEKREQLDVLEQYKKSLIYEYITGKREVL